MYIKTLNPANKCINIDLLLFYRQIIILHLFVRFKVIFKKKIKLIKFKKMDHVFNLILTIILSF